MKGSQFWLGFFVSLAIGFISGIGIKTFYEVKTFKPYEWPKSDPPAIFNCYGKEFSELQMKRAIEYWAIRGYKVGFYEHNPPDSVCEQTWMRGSIILRKVRRLSPPGTIAATRRYTTGTIIKGAEIRYTPGSHNLDLINEHELGHALGFGHVEEKGHVMHPEYHKMGRDFWVP